jgi:hypothetical protein
MILLAFASHTACDCLETLWQQSREAIWTSSRFLRHLRAISACVVLPTGHSLMHTLASRNAPPI